MIERIRGACQCHTQCLLCTHQLCVCDLTMVPAASVSWRPTNRMKTTSESSLPPPHAGVFTISVNDRPLRLDDPVPTSHQVLVAAGFNPADECVLIQVRQDSTRSIALDETIDLRGPGKDVF